MPTQSITPKEYKKLKKAFNKAKEFRPYTHEELGIPKSLEISGMTINIVFDPSILTIEQNPSPNKEERMLSPLWRTGNTGVASYPTRTIKLWPGNELEKPTKGHMMNVFWEEVTHFIFYSLRIHPKDLRDDKFLHNNEHLVVSFSMILSSVVEQVEQARLLSSDNK